MASLWLPLAALVLLQVLVTLAAPNGRGVGTYTTGRIINGTEANLTDTKHQVSIRRRLNDGYFFGTGHICGGSLISENIVLSAAHCFVDQVIYNGTFQAAEDFIVVMGNLDRYEKNEYTLIFDIEKIVYMVDTFNLSTYENDVALLFLNGSVPNNHTTVAPISLTSTAVADNTVCQVTGWGTTESGYLSDVLMTVDVPIINFEVCANETEFAGSGNIRPGMICAGYLEGERDACGGDSGGPMVCQGLQAGIVSWGSGCALPMLPGVYTDVAYYYTWIREQTGIDGGAVAVKCSVLFVSLLLVACNFAQKLFH